MDSTAKEHNYLIADGYFGRIYMDSYRTVTGHLTESHRPVNERVVTGRRKLHAHTHPTVA